MLTRVHTKPVLHAPSHQCSTTLHTFHAISQKNTLKQDIEKGLYKKCKNHYVGMHFTKKTIPQKPTKQATMHTGRHAQTTHTSQRNAFTAYLPSLHLSNYTHHTLYHPHTQHPSPSTIISILIHTCHHIAIQQPPSHPHPQQYSHTTQNAPHNTTSLNLHSNIILFPRNTLRSPTPHSQAQTKPHSPTHTTT